MAFKQGAGGSPNYKPQLDGVRAICVLFTIVNHVNDGAPPFIIGSIGVDIFFALSGFLITHLLAREAQAGGVDLGGFYIRRAFRIIPLYLSVLGLYVVAALALARLGLDSSLWPELKRALPLLATLNSEFRPIDETAFGQAWTLGIEEKFYLVWPLLLPLAWRRPWLAWALLAGLALGLIFAAPHFDRAYGLQRGYGGLAFGCVVAWLARDAGFRSRFLVGKGPVYLALVGLGYLTFFIPGFPGRNLMVSLPAAFLIGSLWEGGGLLTRLLSWRPLAFAGKLTYAIYLLHMLVAHAVSLVLNALIGRPPWIIAYTATYAASLAAAYIAYRLVERPMIELGRRLAKRWAARRDAPAAVLEPGAV